MLFIIYFTQNVIMQRNLQVFKMIVIDGKEAGGQILRTALGLSAITNKSLKVINIRGARAEGGLKTQHLEGILGVAQLCNAEVKGANLGSKEIEFTPRRLEAKELNIKISTAGSIGLLFQSLQIASAFAGDIVIMNIKGGSTASAWSPTVHYIQNVLLPIVQKMDYNAEITIVREAFYPKGGAEVKIAVYPIKRLKSIKLTNPGKVKSISGVSIAGSLPEHVAERQASSAEKFLKERGFDAKVARQTVQTFSKGTSITLWAECEHSILGSDTIGKLGVKAEIIGKKAAKDLLHSIKSQAALDRHMADQCLPFVALAEGRSEVKVEKITHHCTTNIFVIEKMLGVKFEVDKERKIIKANGIGYEGGI